MKFLCRRRAGKGKSLIMHRNLVVGLFLALCSTVAAFSPLPALASSRVRAAASALPVVAASPLRPQVAVSRTSVSGAQMGLFGLGWAEIGVIGLIALFFFGPDKLMPIAKDLGARESSFFN